MTGSQLIERGEKTLMIVNNEEARAAVCDKFDSKVLTKLNPSVTFHLPKKCSSENVEAKIYEENECVFEPHDIEGFFIVPRSDRVILTIKPEAFQKLSANHMRLLLDYQTVKTYNQHPPEALLIMPTVWSLNQELYRETTNEG